MPQQTFPGMSIPYCSPAMLMMSSTPSFATTLLIDATGEKAAMSGRVWFPARTGTKAIRRICFRFGLVTKASGSALTVSLQDVATAAGPPMQPDETPDQTVAVANADANFASNTWYRSNALSADRTVAFGELLSVVWEYDGAGRLGADSVVISSVAASSAGPPHHAMCGLKTAGAWATGGSVPLAIPDVIFEMSDGTFGTLFGSFPCSNISTQVYNSGTGGADEYALEMTFPGPLKVDALGGMWQQAASADVDMIVYDGTSAMANGTVSISNRTMLAAATARMGYGPLSDQLALALGTTYRLAFKPTTANNVTLYYFDVDDANHMTLHPGGTSWVITSRVDSGAWAAPTSTRRPMLWPYISAIDDAVVGGGYLLVAN